MPLLCHDDGGQRGGAVSEYGPRHLPLLPLSFLEREALKVRDPELFIPSVVRSISRISQLCHRAASAFADFAMGVMGSEHATDFVRDDPVLQRTYRARTLKGLDNGPPPPNAIRIDTS